MSDPRFARLKTDPRFRRPKKKEQKVVIDERFKSVFEQDKKGKGKASSRVDKYGRRLSKTHDEDGLKKYYRLEDGSAEEDGEENTLKVVDYARGEVLLESSDEEEEGENGDEHDTDDDSDTCGIIRIGGDDVLEIDLDEDTYTELDAQVAAYAKENANEREEKEVDVSNRTRRLAVVNLDWDHVRASHLYKIFSSLVSPTAPRVHISTTSTSGQKKDPKQMKGGAAPIARGSVLSVRVYPSEFGKERMEREETIGPPVDIFKKKRRDEEINEKTIYELGDEDDYDEDALRRYQLERLRYYYAIVECDTVEVASHIYNELEGTELERSANVFDLSFVPDGMSFENEPRDEVTEDVSTNYRPVEYVTDALRHSKVKLTWDEDDPERYKVTRRQFTRQEIEEADFKAYIASSSSEDEDEGETDKKKSKGKEASRKKLRALLLGGNGDTLPEGWDQGDEGAGDVDMEITFTPGLSESKEKGDETTLERYQKKMKERRKNRKEEQKQKKDSKEKRSHVSENDADDDDFFDHVTDSGDANISEEKRKRNGKADKKNKNTRLRSSSPVPRIESTAEELALLTASDGINTSEPKHFDMKAVLKAEKRKGKRGKKGKGIDGENELQEDFTLDVQDERFKVIHENHQFAIDPTSSHFKKTKGMKALLAERQRRKGETREEGESTHSNNANTSERSLQSLVESVKRKSQQVHGGGKRRRL